MYFFSFYNDKFDSNILDDMEKYRYLRFISWLSPLLILSGCGSFNGVSLGTMNKYQCFENIKSLLDILARLISSQVNRDLFTGLYSSLAMS